MFKEISMPFSPPPVYDGLADILLEGGVTHSLLFMCEVPSHASLSVKQINEQHKVEVERVT